MILITRVTSARSHPRISDLIDLWREPMHQYFKTKAVNSKVQPPVQGETHWYRRK